MRIVYYLPTLGIFGGLQKVIIYKANYFAEHFDNCSITIVTSEQRGKPSCFELSPKINHVDLNVLIDLSPIRSKVLRLLSYPFKYYAFKLKFSRFLFDYKPDITISTLRREINFINTIKDGSIKIGEFHVTRVADHSVHHDKKNSKSGWIKRLWETTYVKKLKKLSKVILLTKGEVAYWPELSNTQVIGNPLTIQPDKFSNCSSHQVIAVGRYAYEKGFDRLINSWKIVSQRHPDWILKIYGGGDREEITKQIHQLHIESTCTAEPATEDIIDKYAASSISVLSSRYEGFGMVITEAMSCGLPVVSFDCPCGPKEVIKDGEDGFLVENGHIRELAEKICYLIEHEDIRKQMGEKARINSERFKMENMAGQWKELFESLVCKKRSKVS